MKNPRGRFLRFLVSGACNTAITYLVFLALCLLVDYLVAYTIAYAVGIAISYMLNTKWVFRVRATWQTATAFPVVYLLQYVWGIALLYLLVDVLGLASAIAVIIVIASGVLITYAVIRGLLARVAV